MTLVESINCMGKAKQNKTQHNATNQHTRDIDEWRINALRFNKKSLSGF